MCDESTICLELQQFEQRSQDSANIFLHVNTLKFMATLQNDVWSNCPVNSSHITRASFLLCILKSWFNRLFPICFALALSTLHFKICSVYYFSHWLTEVSNFLSSQPWQLLPNIGPLLSLCCVLLSSSKTLPDDVTVLFKSFDNFILFKY
jgi:hypothetical protein